MLIDTGSSEPCPSFSPWRALSTPIWSRASSASHVVDRFKVYPRLAGFTCRDNDAEPSFIGYDHPAVIVLHKAAWFATMDYPRVIAHLQSVLELQPAMKASKRRDTLNLLGALSDSTGQHQRAQQYWRASLSLDGNQAPIHRHLGLLLLRLDAEASESLMHLQKAVELAPALRPRLEDLIDRLKSGAG